MSALLAITADLLVAVLLAATIVTSLRLSKRIRGLKEGEAAMRQTIAELVTATDTAERAIARLGLVTADAQRGLGDKLEIAERFVADLDQRIEAERTVISRVQSIVDISRRAAHEHEALSEPSRSQILRSTGSALDALVARNGRGGTRAA